MASNRNIAIDAIRGLAIFTMVGANMAASVAAHPHPCGLRLYGSFAAPLFILLSGMMVALTSEGQAFNLDVSEISKGNA
jgi:uncharacterized membrane protein